ncbi:hypothetical protein RFI_37930 [Reticulomyxa filosa]|uniref:Uncharacterized protein n=1 Tax=Reticulomyxa filosa TaxID=46433 RepID=X6LDU3_RETFI|nr:hypothetical protein RFI_37930 [Reticulomyxa filosa]|eukprot:ETN99540.1 hypothetical protein RFI_37930 [Reticulomyxa filosa]
MAMIWLKKIKKRLLHSLGLGLGQGNWRFNGPLAPKIKVLQTEETTLGNQAEYVEENLNQDSSIPGFYAKSYKKYTFSNHNNVNTNNNNITITISLSTTMSFLQMSKKSTNRSVGDDCSYTGTGIDTSNNHNDNGNDNDNKKNSKGDTKSE